MMWSIALPITMGMVDVIAHPSIRRKGCFLRKYSSRVLATGALKILEIVCTAMFS
jgi:hypothetical protein